MEYASDAYWGNPQRYQFKASINSFGFQTELVENDERVVRSTFDIKINGYIVPEILQKDITALKKFSNKTKIIFGIETTDNTDIIDGTKKHNEDLELPYPDLSKFEIYTK